jgi:hypothetical protein
LGEYLTQWLENTAQNKVRPTTFQRYERRAPLHIKNLLGTVRLSKLRAAHVEYSAPKWNGAARRPGSGRCPERC